LLEDAELLCLVTAQVLLGFAGGMALDPIRAQESAASVPLHSRAVRLQQAAAGELIAKVIRKLAEITPTAVAALRLIDSTPVPCGMSRVMCPGLPGVAMVGFMP